MLVLDMSAGTMHELTAPEQTRTPDPAPAAESLPEPELQLQSVVCEPAGTAQPPMSALHLDIEHFLNRQ